MHSKILTEVIRLWKTRARDLSIMKVHIATDIPFHWLVNFSKGRCKNPPVFYVERLYTYLSGRDIEL